MPITVSTREFNQKASQMLQLSQHEPVFITKWGKIVGVLSSYEQYRQQEGKSLADAFASGHEAGALGGALNEAFDDLLAGIRQHSSKMRETHWGD
ncbi:prevent-host-death family protein [Vandammella animalimorsus]|uniref:Prevent-host-death family protein n=1 Tax=Vandammella animalimorsus TaxID=2029117 RepID=A0A2A2AT42_9BURK|nr:type II toxin-antitoxin system Phd/YefM family antitoxin [Vandammella animalimorsus]PAT40898.1 prevent-host-death family protein [Vandammella animalimorsus]